MIGFGLSSSSESLIRGIKIPAKVRVYSQMSGMMDRTIITTMSWANRAVTVTRGNIIDNGHSYHRVSKKRYDR
jgi:hypothetical protein